ncbi:CHAD domain-containing protein [Marisediminicola sp. UYEF4]|uniref:CYTH and CHAD domain-containing protein n=1 Tax=Marisediminicola sp. UYEF4 TaxID=1756384 RepID=UPI0033924514
MTTHEEIERKYEVDEDASVPDLSDIATVEPAGELLLTADYFDTDSGDLAAHLVVLRRRVGGGDEGWHIKFPAAVGRTELHWPLSIGAAEDAYHDAPASVPAEVIAPILALVRARPLRIIARLHTRRTALHLVGDSGQRLLELADDRVEASDVAAGTLRIWHEWETELLGGAPESPQARSALLDAVEERLLAAGARPAASASKLATALGRTSLAPAQQAASLDRASPASEILLAAIGALVADIARIDPLVRLDRPDSVHQLRTRVRRLRSLFVSYRRVFNRAVTDPIRDELQHLGVVLGEARDAEVMRDRARALIADHDALVAGLGTRLVDGWAGAYSDAHGRVLAELSSPRYLALLDSLDEFLARPPLAEDAFASARTAIPPALARDLNRVLRTAKAADAAQTEPERIELLHATRKAAKRLRYAAEAVSAGVGGVFGRRVRTVAAAAEAIHDLLGEHRDSSLMQEYLRATARSGEHAFDYGVLHEVERHGAALCLADYPGALDDLKRLR